MEFLDEPTSDGYGVVTVARWGGWLVQVMPMLYNDRLVLTPEAQQDGYEHGWCYPKGAAVIAAAAWNPETQAEPVGYIKRVMPFTRAAGERCRTMGGRDGS